MRAIGMICPATLPSLFCCGFASGCKMQRRDAARFWIIVDTQKVSNKTICIPLGSYNSDQVWARRLKLFFPIPTSICLDSTKEGKNFIRLYFQMHVFKTQ